MGGEMRPPGRGPGRLLNLLLITGFLLIGPTPIARTQDDAAPQIAGRNSDRNARNDATTVLLVSARQGQRQAPPIGLLAKTARTFVQDGASTEYATQVVGTTLNNGRLYARILSTSSRVFYEKDESHSNTRNVEPTKVNPYLVYPSRIAPQDEWKLFGGIIEDDSSADKREEAIIRKEISSSSSSSSVEPQDRENDIFGVRREFNVDNHQRFKPSKVRAINLPTYTVKHELVGGSSAANDAGGDEDGHRSYRSRVPKIFRPQSSRASWKKEPVRPQNTVTYHGFADFTTIVGDTVIVFSPSTAPSPVGRAATTIKGDATLRPADGKVVSIQPSSVVPTEKTVDPLLEAINGRARASVSQSSNLIPSIAEPEETSVKPTPVLISEKDKPTGLLKTVDSTTSSAGTTTHYKSLIYGTYIGTNYAQIIHTSSNVYFFPEETNLAYDTTTFGSEDDVSTPLAEVTTPSAAEADGTQSPEDNELSTPLDETTEKPANVRVASTTPMEPEIFNDINADPQGRSVKGGSPKNNVAGGEEKKNLGFATRLLPSTSYKTLTYFTTFFIPDETNRDVTTTSIKSREVVSSEVSYLTELILPSATVAEETETSSVSPSLVTSSTPAIESSSVKIADDDPPAKREEIELIFKTLYTTYTYLTTFFQESTSSVSSREVVETNIVTQTIGPDGIFGDVVGLFSDDVVITPTKIQNTIEPSAKVNSLENEEITTFEAPTTIEDSTTESGTTLSEELKEENYSEVSSQLEPSPIATDVPKFETKTYFTTYTYFTTIFVDDETEIETRTEVFSNVVTEAIEPTAVISPPQETSAAVTTPKSAPVPPPEILAYLEALKKQKSSEEALKLAKKVQELTPQLEATSVTTEEPSVVQKDVGKAFEDGEVLGSMVTDVVSSSSSSDGPVLEPSMEKRNVGSQPEDQELSESNHHDVEPAPTLLLRTSYTTFTYFTTMYKGDSSNVASRLETVTNIVTETIRPTPAAEMPMTETSSLPVTYFTTFTYWTTLYKAGDTITTSREETVSNVVTPGVSPTPAVKLGVIMTYRPDATTEPVDGDTTDTPTTDNEVMMHEKSTTPIPTVPQPGVNAERNAPIDASTVSPEPTTYYTTFTYFTTSYIGNETVLNSRLETITSVALGDALTPTGRAIGSAVKVQELEIESKVPKVEITPTKIVDEPKTGLLSTVRSSLVANGTTTHFATDVYGTYIDGLYAQLAQSSTSLETPMVTATSTVSETPALPTGVLSLNKGSIIDADQVTTVFFTTSQVGTLIDGLYAKVIESTSSTTIDAERKASLKVPEDRHRTGLVRLIKGQIEADGSTVVYQSKVIGTSIEGRYAQIIESTSSYLLSSTSIAPSSTLIVENTAGVLAPTPAVIQPSISDSHNDEESNEDNREGEEDSEDNEAELKAAKKSRPSFSSRKRNFTPTIRPFASRSRPTFNPKRKGPQGATTITRTDITPTITATLAGGKGNRFASSRGRPALSSAAAGINPSRRFSGRRSSATLTPTASLSSARGRVSGRISASSSYAGRRGGASSIRGSSARPAIRASSSAYPGASSRFRAGIRASSTLQKSLQTASLQASRAEDQEDEANEFTATTVVTEETLSTDFDESDEATTVPTTTESARRSTNPLLRFRRPLIQARPPIPRRTATKAPVTAAPRSSNGRSLNSPTLPPFAARSRSNNRFFPPRNLVNQRQPEPAETVDSSDEEETHLEDERAVEEILDNDYEGSENNKRHRAPSRAEVTTASARGYLSRFTAQRRRFRRQVSQLRSQNRYRRPGGKSSSAENRSDDTSAADDEETQKSPPRYTTRSRSLSTPRSPGKSSAEKYSADSAEASKRTRRPTAGTRVKPTPTTNSGRQFTLRDKNPTGYKRSSTKQDPRRSNSRVRTTTRRTNDFDSRRTTSRSTSRTRNTSRRIPQRSRGSKEDLRDYGSPREETITVTHYVPTELTIPVSSNGVTEIRSIVTASPSLEILSPNRYSTVTGSDGKTLLVIASESSSVNNYGQTEVTHFIIHSSPTSTQTHTLATIGGRRISQSVIVPSTVYSIENIVSTVSASIDVANAPLANILLSQLLLGQFGQANPLLGALQPSAVTPTTRFDTRTTTYVTTITKTKSTVIPLTFRGKEIMTTLTDSSTDVVTATEFITDTIVVTPTAVLPAANLNSLLYLLQQPQPLQQPQDPLFAVAPIFTQSNSLPGEVERRHQPADLDYRPNEEVTVEEETQTTLRAKSEKAESSVVTLYVSGKRPGEFSTVLTTVKVTEDATATRRRRNLIQEVRPSAPPSIYGHPEASSRLSSSEELANAHAPTQSLESVVDDNTPWSIDGSLDSDDSPIDYAEIRGPVKRKKIVRVRLPAQPSASVSERHHKYTIVRKRPLMPYTRPSMAEELAETVAPTSRRIVITRVRSLGARSRHFPEDLGQIDGTARRHRVTVTRTRKLTPTVDVGLIKTPRTRVTRKKLVTVRPVVEPTSSFAIITTGFYGIPNDDEEEYIDEDDDADSRENGGDELPSLLGSLDDLNDKPHTINAQEDPSKPLLRNVEDTVVPGPVIITENFFLPPSDSAEDEEYDMDDFSTTEKNIDSVDYSFKSQEIPFLTASDNSTEKTSEEEENKMDNHSLENEGDNEGKITKNIDNHSQNVTTDEESTEKNPQDTPGDEKKIEQAQELEESTEKNVEATTETALAEENCTVPSTTLESVISDLGEETPASLPPEIPSSVAPDTVSTPKTPKQVDKAYIEEKTSVEMNSEIIPSVVPLEEITETEIPPSNFNSEGLEALVTSAIPSVIPLESSMTLLESDFSAVSATETLKTEFSGTTTTLIVSPTPEDIEAGLSDELYLSLSKPDLPEISSKLSAESVRPTDVAPELEPTPTVVFSETIITSTRLRTYTYVVTKLNGLETQVTSSTTVRPRVTTLTLTVPVTIVPSSTPKRDFISLSTSATATLGSTGGDARESKMLEDDAEGEGRRLNLATRVMSNGVEVIVAGPTPALRWENSNPQPTLTLSDAVVMLMPQEDPNEFVTKTCTTTFTYLNTITKDGTTIVSTDQQVVANTAIEERHRKPGAESAAVTLEASPTLRTEVFKTTYTYLTLDTDHPDVHNALSSSQKVIANTVTAPQHYLDMILEPSEVSPPQTNTYLSTRVLEKTLVKEGVTRIETKSDNITRLIITESAQPPPRPTSVATTLTALDNNEDGMTDLMKTYYITYTYYNTYLDKGTNTVIRTNVATSTDIAVEKVPKKTGVIDSQTVTSSSPDPIKIFATKTYLTTYTYFTTLLQAGADGETATTISSRSHVVENVVTESIAPSLLNAGYMNLLTTAHHSDSVKNVVTGSTIIFFDEDDQIDAISTNAEIQPTASLEFPGATINTNSELVQPNESDIQSDEPTKQQTNSQSNSEDGDLSTASTSHGDDSQIDESDSSEGSPSQPSGGLLSLGSLGINGLSALGPVITAMAGLLKGKPSATRRNDTVLPPSPPPAHLPQEPPKVTSQRSPIYIPVAEFVDGDIEAAESQNIATQLANPNPNFIPETRHKVAASLVDGIPISPGEIITANSDVIIGKPGILSPRPPQTYTHENNDQNIGMKPPPMPAPSLPILDIIKDDNVPESSQQVQHGLPTSSKRPQKNSHFLNKEPATSASKHDILENDPLLKPPARPNIDKYANPNINPKEPEWFPDRFRRPWSSKDPLAVPPTPSRIDQSVEQEIKPWMNRPQEPAKRPMWAQRDPINSVHLEGSEGPKPEPTVPSEPIVHQVPHVIDRSTGQPLLVNIQPSQVANVVIPQGGTQALIFGDTNEPHISGQYFDDPSPYPDPEVGPSFGGFDKHETNPADYMTPPAPPAINFKPLPQKPFPHTIPISNSRIYSRIPRPHDKIEISTNSRPEKRPSDILLIQRPDSSGQSSQGQVHTEILVHHSADVTSLHAHNRPNQLQTFNPPRWDFQATSDIVNQLPPRRTADISPSTESTHRFSYHGKPNRTLAEAGTWKNDRTKPRITIIRPRPLGHGRPGGHFPDRVQSFTGGKRHPPQRPHISLAPRPPQIPVNWQEDAKVDSSSADHSQDPQYPPTGVVSYINPLLTSAQRPETSLPTQSTSYEPGPSKNHQVQQMPPDITPPEIQSFGQILPRPDEPDVTWSETQTEAGPDSDAQESEESVKYHPTDRERDSERPKQDEPAVEEEHIQADSSPVTIVDNQGEKSSTEPPPSRVEVDKKIEQDEKDHVNSTPNDDENTPDNHKAENEDENPVETYEDSEAADQNDRVDYELADGSSFGMKVPVADAKPNDQYDTIDLTPPAIIPHFVPEKPTRPQWPTVLKVRPTTRRPLPIHEDDQAPNNEHNPPGGHARPLTEWNSDKKNVADVPRPFSNRRNLTLTRPGAAHTKPDTKYIDTGAIRVPGQGILGGDTRFHLGYPQIVTKPRPAVPPPVTISSGSQTGPRNPNKAEEPSSSDRPGSLRPTVVIYTKDRNRETLETAYQTNFASTDSEEDGLTLKKPQHAAKIPSQDMMPPPPTLPPLADVNSDDTEDLKPPPNPSDVVGLSPPPVAITTTTERPTITSANESGLRPPPPKYIPLSGASRVVGETPPPPPPPPVPSVPSVSMVPPTVPRPTKSRPFLMELLSHDMVPPRPPLIESSRPIEIATVRPAIAVSGSIQIATEATSHIPVMHDLVESTIPIVHGTVDLPVIMDVSDILKSVETRKSEHVSIYTVRPFETRVRDPSRVSVQPTAILSTNLIMPTRLRLPQIEATTSSSISNVHITRAPSYEAPRRSSVHLEASRQATTIKINPTHTHSLHRPHSVKHSINPSDVTFTSTSKRKYNLFTKSREFATKPTPEMGVTSTRNATTTSLMTTTQMKPKAVTHFTTQTVTRTETSVIGSPPTTITLLLTHTLTSTIVETVTETLLRPTNVVITSVTTILQPATRLPTYETHDNMDSIFVVMSDQNPPAAGAEEVEAEYGTEEEVSRDEQDPAGNEIHRVLSGSVLGAAVVPPHPPTVVQCQPECRASKSEMCTEVNGEPRCICRPGFARMFPDRPCKPTYTFTLRVGLDRIGRESVKYEHSINDTSSLAFRRLAAPTREALDRTLMQSDLRDVYRGLDIAGFHPNPPQVEFHVQLSDNTSETRLKDTLKKYLISGNYSLGGTDVFASKDLDSIHAKDFDECSTEEGGPHHDCSPRAACFNLRGSYQCSCKEGWADLSENPAYPGRICSQAPLGCASCSNKGHCITSSTGQEVCECFPWHSGQRCQVNLKVLLIALVTTGAILLGLLGVCLALACFRHPSRTRKSGDRRAMIASGAGGDTSSEGSLADLAIPHHVPHVLPPPPRSTAPAPPGKRPKKPVKQVQTGKKPYAGNQGNDGQMDRSLSVMIPRAKYRSGPHSPQNYSKPPMSTFAPDEHKLISYLETGPTTGRRKCSLASTTKEYVKCYEESGQKVVKNAVPPTNGALVSAGFQVSATVMRTIDGDSAFDDTLEPSTLKTLRSTTDFQDGASTLVRSCEAPTIQATTKLLPLDLGGEDSSVGRSCAGDTSTKQPALSRASKDTRDARDSASEGPITAERDLGSTLRLRHTPLYSPDRAASDRDSNFDSL